jgi:hypothetical protein
MEEHQHAIRLGPLHRHTNPNGAADHTNEGPAGEADPARASGVGAGLASPAPSTASDYPTPRAISDDRELVWDEDDLALDNYRAVGRRLADTGDLYRRPDYGSGLLLASPQPNIDPMRL